MTTTIRSAVDRLAETATLFGADDDAPWLGPPASPAEIETLEASERFALPAEFRELLALHRAIIAMEVLNGYWIGASNAGPLALAVVPATARCGVDDVDVIVLATDGGGNCFLRPLTEPSVWRWDHETEVTHKVAEDLATFLHLVADDWDHAARGDDAHVSLVHDRRYR